MKCYNCKVKFKTNDKRVIVKQKGQIREWCSECWEGYEIYLEEKKLLKK
jgi:hypothetical protein